MERRAFITGSHAYGTPRPDSDIDLVILVDSATCALLCDGGSGPSRVLADGTGKAFYGSEDSMLNLIILTDPAEFDLWLKGTQELIAMRPVDRETAKKHLTAMGLTNQGVGQDPAGRPSRRAAVMRWAVEIYHPHFGWLRWEEGDKSYSTKPEAEAAAIRSAYKTRIVQVQ